MFLHVKLHDMVRDSAITIASQHNNKDIFPDWSNRVWLKDLPTSLQCPKAEFLVLSCEDLCLEIPDLFFEGIPELKVVGFTSIHFATSLPSSLVCLKNLDTLCLHRCQLDNISFIGELTQLKILSFADSDIVELPREIGALTQLKLLDLTNCSKLQVIPKNVISELLSLEELCMRNAYVRWDEEGNVSLAELEKLSCLSSLEIQIVNPKSILKFGSFYNILGRYKIIIGEEEGIRWEKYAMSSSRMLKLKKLEGSFHLEDAVKVFSREIEDLWIDEVSGMDDLIKDGFPRLRQLCIKNDHGIQHLVESPASNPFPVLESLLLDSLNSLKMVCDGPLEMRCFGNLRSLKISDCDKLKSLFSSSSYGCLGRLEEMEVESCEKMETLLSEGSEDIRLACLRSLKLKNLPNLKGICNKKGLLFHDKLSLYNLASLEVKICKSLKYVFTTSGLKFCLKLERLEINDCELVEEIIWHKESEVEEGIDKIELPSLKYVVLKKLKNLKRFGSGFPIEFTSLTEFSIHKCPAKECFVPESAEKNGSSKGNECHFGENVILYNLDGKRFPRMTHLHIQNGYGIPHTITLKDLNSLESFRFGELRSLKASNCNKLKNLFSFSSAKCSAHLLDLEVQSCHNIEVIVSRRCQDEILELTQFRSLRLDNIPHLTGFCEQKQGSGPAQLLFDKMVSVPNLTSLVVEKCNSLKFVFTTSMVKCLVQLKELGIGNCELVESIIHINKTEENEEEIINLIVFRKLEALSLNGLPNMKMFACGYEVEFPVLRELSLECSAMANFVSKSSDGTNNYNADEHLFNELVTISNLESLIVRNMDTFRYLWHEEIILDSFLKLKSLNIANCSMLSVLFPVNVCRRIQKLETKDEQSQDIIFSDTSLWRVEMLQETEEYFKRVVIEFPLLCSLKLKNLPHLTGFCCKRDQGFGTQVSFPSLKSLELCECKNFKYVFTTKMVNCLLQLEKLEIRNCELVEEILLSGHFDETNDIESFEKIVFPKLKYLLLEELPNMKTFSSGYSIEFQLLKELSISYCPVLNNFVPKYLGNDSDENLFNEMVTFSNLERMEVSHTNCFKYLWGGQSISDNSFLKLKSLRIEYCSKLTVVFPTNKYRRFQALETLYLCCCFRVEEIYRYEGNNFEEVNITEPCYLRDLEIRNLPSLKYIWSHHPHGVYTYKYLRHVKVVSCKDLMFVFPNYVVTLPQLTVLQLENLYQMRNLHVGLGSIACPNLKQFGIYGCNLKDTSLFFIGMKFNRNLKELTLDDQGFKLIMSAQLGVEFSKLKRFTVHSLEKESIPLLARFIRRFSLKKLVFVESYVEVAFLWDNGDVFGLEHLEVVGDDSLKHILKKDSRFNPILEKLRTLHIKFCESLINISPSTASFENLTSLNISVCSRMVTLVTASTAKTMTNLKVLKVSECPMMEEIFENSERDVIYIVFHKLKCLELCDLPTLNSFCSGNSVFKFPLLERVVVKKCFAMKNFCDGRVFTPNIWAIPFQDEQRLKGNLNVIIASHVKSRVTITYSY